MPQGVKWRTAEGRGSRVEGRGPRVEGGVESAAQAEAQGLPWGVEKAGISGGWEGWKLREL